MQILLNILACFAFSLPEVIATVAGLQDFKLLIKLPE